MAPTEPPLVVSVEGALVSGDLGIEGAARLLAASPGDFLGLLLSGGGRAARRRRIAERVPLAPSSLVLNRAVLDEIAAARAAGREVWLVTAGDELAVAPLVEAVGAAGRLALDRDARAAALADRFGERGFDYAGCARSDLAVWRRARRAIGVGLSGRLSRRLSALREDARLLPGFGGRRRDDLRGLRPHQWVKNLLVFAPLVAAHETAVAAYGTVAGMFVAISACASGTYLLNDLLDLPHDRRRASKRRRPVAAGRVGLPSALGFGAALATGGLALAFWLSGPGGLCVLLYLVLTLAYSLWLKRKLFVDVVTLGLLYMVRVFAGGMAIPVTLSPWFLAFFMCAFFSMAVVKRLGELQRLRASGGATVAGRAWHREDSPVLAAFGGAAGFASVLVFALWIQSPEVSALYRRPEFLWAICPLFVTWLGRVMLLANRGIVDDDPVVFTLRDRPSWLTGLGILGAFAVAL